jgi:hypothetical protein
MDMFHSAYFLYLSSPYLIDPFIISSIRFKHPIMRYLITLLFAIGITGGLLAQPTITSFAPVAAPAGSSVTITGSNFSTVNTDNVVYFGSVKAAVTAASATSLTVTVPNGATYKPITVTVNNLTAFSPLPFTLTYTSDGAVVGNTYTEQLEFLIAYRPRYVHLADLDGDGKPDLLSTEILNLKLHVLRNTSSGGRRCQLIFSFQEYQHARHHFVGWKAKLGCRRIHLCIRCGRP